MRLRGWCFVGAPIAALAICLVAVRGQSANGRELAPNQKAGAILVELFTSEGCSSCPPADALLRQIDGKHTNSGQLIVGVSEHVTYWNHLGWSDPYSASAYTERQDAYGMRFRLDNIYTPQMVINGEQQLVGSDSASLLHALATAKEQAQVSVQIGSASINSKALDIDFSVAGNLPSHGVEVYAILADDSVRSDVLHGENAGRTLMHSSVARTMTRVATVKSPLQRTVHVPLPATVLRPPGHARHLIMFVQGVNYGPVLAVDTRAL
jgi:hypothetical protein